MVCNRCKFTVLRELQYAGYSIDSIELRQVILRDFTPKDYSIVESTLKHQGFENVKEMDCINTKTGTYCY